MIKTKMNKDTGLQKVTKYSDEDYIVSHKKILTVKDNGNGFTIKRHSWSSCEADQYLSIDYATAADLVDCLALMDFRDE